ncbi:urease accessory protein UreD [Nereida sp. MMG024]|nr:urease accessory protein UreD [Nereida sp. MMG025]
MRQSGATKLVFPRQTAKDIEAILINTAGGVTGGDRFELDATVQTGAELSITTQAAERAYRAQSDEVGRITTRLCVERRARLNWLPQEMILFEGSALTRTLDIELASDAELLMVEPVVFGRAAMGETLHDITFRDRITINREGKPLYLDAVHICGDAASLMARSALAKGCSAMASVVLVCPDAATRLAKIRSLLPPTAGASLLAEDTLVVRHLAQDSFLLRRDLVPTLEAMSNRPLPTSWRL